MIRPLLLTAGSRGDVEPLLAVLDGLTKSPSVEHTTLVIPNEYLYLVPKSTKVTTLGINFSVEECIKIIPAFSDPETAQEVMANDKTTEIKSLAMIIRLFVLPNTKRIVELAESSRCTVVMASVFASAISNIIHEKIGIPHIMLYLQPMYPSAYMPNIMTHPEEAATAVALLHEGRTEEAFKKSNLKTYMAVEKALDKTLTPYINAERKKLGMEPMPIETAFAISTGSAPETYAMIAVQSQLSPRAPDFSPRTHIVGSLGAAFIPAGFKPDSTQAELASFIAAGPRPIAVTYGSMDAQGVADKATRELIRGLRAADAQRVVLLPGNAKLGLHHLDGTNSEDAELIAWANDHVFVTKGNVQYAWLFPQCAMVFCHCGAGTTSAALHAGVPVLGTPFMVDQYFFAELLCRLKLGMRVGSTGLASITAEEVERAVQIGRSDEISGNARAFGEEEKRRNENVAKVCELIVEIAK